MKNLQEEEVVEEKTESENVSQPESQNVPVISEGKQKLKQWLNKNFRIEMTDGRILVGVFVCTDRDANVILGSCSEYLKAESDGEEPRVLGLVMVPGRHIVSIQIDDSIPTYNRNSSSAAE